MMLSVHGSGTASLVKEMIVSQFRSLSIPHFDDIIEYLSGSFGSFFRSRLLIEMSRMLGTLDEIKITLSSSIEILHYATLLHDDVIDNCTYRRKNHSLNSLFGDKAAILAGDILFGLASRMIIMTGKTCLYKYVVDTALRMSEGEVVELRLQGNTGLALDDYLRIIDDKTGSLFGLTFLFASFNGGEIDDRFYKKGVEFGRYFQIIDDSKDYMLDFKNNTKPVFNDFSSGTMTYPLILLMASADQDENAYLRERFGKSIPDRDIDYIRSLFQKYQIFSLILEGMDRKLENIFRELGFAKPDRFNPIILEMLNKVKNVR